MKMTLAKGLLVSILTVSGGMLLGGVSALPASATEVVDAVQEKAIQEKTIQEKAIQEKTGTQDKPEQSQQVQSQQGQAQQLQQWVMIAQDKRQDDATRAEALKQLARYPNQNSLVAVARALGDESAVVREAAVVGAEPYQFAHRWRMLSPLLSDSELRVRLTATTNLVRNFAEMSPEQQSMLEKPAAELEAYLEGKKDSQSQLLLADVYRWQQQWQPAQALYDYLLLEDKTNPQIWLSMADNYRAQGENEAANKLLLKAQFILPDNANLYYSQALTLVRLNQKADAATAIQKSTELEPRNSYFWYLNGVLQEPIDIKVATASFEKAYQISGAPEQLYAVCDIYIRHDHQNTKACLDELAEVAPPYVIDELKSKQG